MIIAKLSVLPSPITEWFTQRGWQPRRHQLEMVEAAVERRHALLVAATGAGKTLAGFLPTLVELISALPFQGRGRGWGCSTQTQRQTDSPTPTPARRGGA